MGFEFERRTYVNRGASASRSPSTVGATASSARTPQSREQKMNPYERAFKSLSAGTGSSANNLQFGNVALDIDVNPLLEGMDYNTHDKMLFDVYRDIYFFDPIGGSFVDMYSTLPFGDFSFGGAKDSLLAPYYETCERLHIESLLPGITTDRMVTGAHVSSLLYDTKAKKFLDLMCHRYDNVEVTALPFNNQDPILEWTPPFDTQRALNHNSKRIAKLRDYFGAALFDKIAGGEKIELDPVGTIYLPRNPFSSGPGVSCFRRILPVWLIEKNLYRGTLIESGRRQRGILHAQLGDGMDWEASVEEMQYITDLLLAADTDPIGAVIATRLGVQINEFRQGGDFWKITDVWDQTSQYKLRALGASEALLSGDATFANGEQGMMAFMESMASARAELTRNLFYEKIFPLVSMINGLAVNNAGRIVRKEGMMEGKAMDIMNRMNDGSRLFIPTVHWAKRLRPDSDQGQMEALRAMSELGVPVPLRAIAAAGGYNLEQLLGDQDENLAMQRKLLDYKKRFDELTKEVAGEDAEGGGGGGSFSSTSSAVLGGARRPGIGGRNFDLFGEPFEFSPSGKKKHVFRQARFNAKANDSIMKSISMLDKSRTEHLTGGAVAHR